VFVNVADAEIGLRKDGMKLDMGADRALMR
jgi:hypothetical protein